MDNPGVFVLLAALTFGAICAVIAGRRESNMTPSMAGLIGALLGPIGLVIVILDRGHLKKCPECAKDVPKAAKRCPYCGVTFSD